MDIVKASDTLTKLHERRPLAVAQGAADQFFHLVQPDETERRGLSLCGSAITSQLSEVSKWGEPSHLRYCVCCIAEAEDEVYLLELAVEAEEVVARLEALRSRSGGNSPDQM